MQKKIDYFMIFYYWTKYLVLYPEALNSKKIAFQKSTSSFCSRRRISYFY